MNRKQAGSKGGRATFEKHGRDHMSRIGKAGAASTWSRYYLAPVNMTEYAMTERATGRIVRIIGR
jgi:hypothetical protein